MSNSSDRQNLIGLIGLKGSGKSTIAKYLTTNHNFTELTFAEPLKEIAVIMGFKKEHVYGSTAKKEIVDPEIGLSPREFLQKFGTEFGREYIKTMFPTWKLEGNLWVNIMKKKLIDLNKSQVVVSDVRFHDEIDLILSQGGFLINIIRNSKRKGANEQEQEQEHSSELLAANFITDEAHTIDNSGTLEDTITQIKKIIN